MSRTSAHPLRSLFGDLLRGRVPGIAGLPAPLLDLAADVASWRGRHAELSSVERVLTSFRHRQPERVPVTPLLCSGARTIAGASFADFASDAEVAADAFVGAHSLVGGDIIVLLVDLSVEAADFGQKLSYPDDSLPMPVASARVIESPAGYARIKPLALGATPRMDEFVRLCELVVGRVGMRALVTGFLFGPLGVLSMMRGAEALFIDCVRSPGEVRKGCEAITETLIEFARAQCEAGVPALVIDTLYASHNGLPERLWEQIEAPFVAEISREIKRCGRLVGVHNCGHAPYFSAQLRSMEADVISFAHLPGDCRDMVDLKCRYGDRVTLVGFIDTPLLSHGTPRQVMDACRRQIDVLGRDGGFVLAPGCEYPANTPLTNAFAMVRAAELSA